MKAHTIAPEQCAARFEVKDQEEIFQEIARRVAAQREVDEKTVFNALTRREATASTGLEKGVALPHCALPKIDGFAIGAITLAMPIDCKSLDGNPADIFIYIVGPESSRTEHIHVLGAISRRIQEPAVREHLRAQTSAAELASTLQSWFPARGHEEPEHATLLLLYVQQQELYRQLLETVSLEDDVSISISQVKRAGSVLRRVPLFSGFWKEHEHEEINRIEVIVPRHGVNQLIRRLEEMTKGKSGVKICAIDLNHSSGSLDF